MSLDGTRDSLGGRVPISTRVVSPDAEERACAMAERVGVDTVRFAYDLPLTKAREWGFYISTSRGKTSIGIEEPALFSEPGLFMVAPDQ